MPTANKWRLLVCNNYVVLFEKLNDVLYEGWTAFLGLGIITLGMSKAKKVS